jgi:hypothetical protein
LNDDGEDEVIGGGIELRGKCIWGELLSIQHVVPKSPPHPSTGTPPAK